MHSTERKLAILGISSIVLFIVVSIYPGFGDDFGDATFEQFILAYIILGGVVPWVYLLEKARNRVSKPQLLLYFLGCWLTAPYFLLRHDLNEVETNHAH